MSRTASLLALMGGAALLLQGALFTPPVRAHAIQSTLERISGPDGGSKAVKLEVQSTFSSGDPASEAQVRLLPAGGGSPIALGHTGVDGRLSFTLPPMAQADGEIQVDAGPGHRDYLELPGIDPAGAPAAPSLQARSSLQRQSWLGQASSALVVIGLVSVVGLLSLERRDS